VNGVSFDLTDQQAKLMATARANAVADAKARASEDATAAGRSLGGVVNISESDDFDLPHPIVPLALFANRASAVPLAAGTQQVTVSVIISWALA
jgi:uncharacterized protein YggE